MIVEPVVRKLDEVLASLDHIAGLLEAQARLLRILVEETRGDIEFEAEGDAWADDGEALTA